MILICDWKYQVFAFIFGRINRLSKVTLADSWEGSNIHKVMPRWGIEESWSYSMKMTFSGVTWSLCPICFVREWIFYKIWRSAWTNGLAKLLKLIVASERTCLLRKWSKLYFQYLTWLIKRVCVYWFRVLILWARNSRTRSPVISLRVDANVDCCHAYTVWRLCRDTRLTDVFY